MKLPVLLSILSIFYFAYANVGQGNPDSVEVLIWSGGSWAGFLSTTYKTPNYLGHDVDKSKWNCPVDCKYTGDKRRLGNADAVIFEAQPLTSYYDDYKRAPPQWAQKYYNQFWVNYGYETPIYFNLYADPGYTRYIDINMTYTQESQVHITFTCFWGGGSEEDFLRPHPPKYKDKCVAFMTTNCGSGGATYRTAYVKELMEHMHIDSLGKCLHNTDLPKEMQFPIYSDHGSSMRNKITIFQDYKFVLCFENNNITDYVTEKLPNVLQAGTVPIYMGAPNVHPDWTPGENSIIRVSDFKGPRELAKYLKKACSDDDEYEKFFEWKKKGLSPQFKEKLDHCVFYGAECRLCQYIHEQRKKLTESEKEALEERRKKQHQYYVLEFSGNGQHITVPSSPSLELEKSFTISAWVKFYQYDVPILDRGQYRLSMKTTWKRGYLELCVADQCFTGAHPMVKDSWYHIVTVFNYEETGGFVNFYVNGVKDAIREVPDTYPRSYSDSPLYIATNKDKSSYFQGLIDDLSIWNIAFDEKRAQKLVFDIPSGIEDGLVAYWGFNQDPKEAVEDATGENEGKTVGEVKWQEGLTKPLVTSNPCL